MNISDGNLSTTHNLIKSLKRIKSIQNKKFLPFHELKQQLDSIGGSDLVKTSRQGKKHDGTGRKSREKPQKMRHVKPGIANSNAAASLTNNIHRINSVIKQKRSTCSTQIKKRKKESEIALRLQMREKELSALKKTENAEKQRCALEEFRKKRSLLVAEKPKAKKLSRSVSPVKQRRHLKATGTITHQPSKEYFTIASSYGQNSTDNLYRENHSLIWSHSHDSLISTTHELPQEEKKLLEHTVVPRSIKRIFEKFATIIEGHDTKDHKTIAVLDYQEFPEAFCAAVKHPDSSVVSKLFRSFDISGIGYLTLNEFNNGVHKFQNGTDPEKVQIIFEMYADSTASCVNVQDLYSSLVLRSGDIWEEVIFTHQLVSTMDVNGDGSLDLQEFYHACMEVPMFFKCFAGTLPIYLSNQASEIRAGLTLPELCKLWTSGVSLSKMNDTSGHDEIDYRGFRPIATELFRMSQSSVVDQNLCKRLFQMFDKDGTGSIDFAEFMSGISSLFYGSSASRAAVFHAIMDVDGSGEISAEELRSILSIRGKRLYRTDGSDTALEEIVSSIMDAFDSDGDRLITTEEFVASSVKNPELLVEMEYFLFIGERADGQSSLFAEDQDSDDQSEENDDQASCQRPAEAVAYEDLKASLQV